VRRRWRTLSSLLRGLLYGLEGAPCAAAQATETRWLSPEFFSEHLGFEAIAAPRHPPHGGASAAEDAAEPWKP